MGLPGKPGRSWTGLRVNAEITKTDSKKPNKAKVQVYNLGPDSRGFISQDGMVMQVLAGYGEPELVFQGDIDEVSTQKDGLDVVATIEGGDGRKKFQDGRLVQTYLPPNDSGLMLTRIANAMGIQLAPLPPELKTVIYTSAYTVAGPTRDALDDLTRTLEANWSIQDGELLITLIGKATTETAFLVSPSSGLIGRPEKQKKGLKFRMLLNGKIKPRRMVRLESQEFTGFYLPKKVTHSFDSGFDSTFYTDIEAVEVTPNRP